MKTRTIKTYTAKELKELFPASFEKALAKYAETVERLDADIWGEDILASIKGAFKAAGITLKDYSLGAYCQSTIESKFPDTNGEDIGALKGPRAMAWLENNFLGPLRVTAAEAAENRRKGYTKYKNGYRIGQIRSCPFTGCCYDDEIIERIQTAVNVHGEDLRGAFEDLANYYRDTLEKGIEYQQEPDQFIESSDANDLEFTEDGEKL